MGNKLGRKRQIVDDRYTKPQQGLYTSKDVDIKKLKKLILESKLAPCYPGDDESSCHHDLEECPICFLFYPSLNRSRCCMKSVCTECFLRMKSPNTAQPIQCPFCKTSNYVVEYRGRKTKEEKSIEQIEEQRVIEAKIRMRQKEVEEDEERMQKRLESFSSSSSTSAATVDTEYGSAAGDDEEIVSSQDSCLPSHPQVTRDGQSDFDLEDIMVMEAIWLSMQKPGIQRNTSPDEISEKDHNVEPSAPSSSSPSGGLACAIAVLAERQQMVGESSSNQNVNVASHNMVPGNCNNSPYNTIEQDSNHYLQGAGTSYTRSDVADDSANEISREVTWR